MDVGRVVILKWKDVIQTSDWTSHTEVECPTFESIGYLCHQDGNTVKIASTIDEEGEMSGILCMPWACVIDIEYVDKERSTTSTE